VTQRKLKETPCNSLFKADLTRPSMTPRKQALTCIPLRSLDWSKSVLIEGEVAESVAALKREEGPELQVHGSGNLIQTLLRHELIDEFRLWTFPLVVGRGKRLFSDGTIPAGLKLNDSTVSSTGVMIGTYVPAGEVVTGSFALDEPTDGGNER